MLSSRERELAETVRDECIQTALSAYENAAMSGLCGEGAFEAAISALRMMDVAGIAPRGNASPDEAS